MVLAHAFSIPATIAFIVVAAISTHVAAEIKTELVEYHHQGTLLQGYIAYDDTSELSRPGILVCHEWWGHNEYVQRRARELAELGYVAFAIDMYGKGELADTPEKAGTLAGAFYADRELMRSRAAAGLQLLREHRLVDRDNLAAIGYCFGGTVALELARSGAELKAAVCFHGGLSTPNPDDAKNIKCEILICNGEQDPFVPEEERTAFRNEMNNASVTYTFIEYSGAVHAFTNPSANGLGIAGAAYNERAEERSWQHMRILFNSVLNK